MKNRAIIHDINEFLKTEPLFCLKCKNFTYTASEYCEKCGSRFSLRKPRSKDVRQYNNAIRKGTQDQLKVQEIIRIEEFPTLKFKSDNDLKDFLFIERYFCIYCKKFTIRNRGYCENCGTRSSLRKSKKKDIEQCNKIQDLKRHEKLVQKQLKTRMEPSESKLDISQLKPKELKTATSEWKEKLGDIPSPKMKITEDLQPTPPEKSFSEPTKLEVKTLQPIPTSISKEEKPEESFISQTQKIPIIQGTSINESSRKVIDDSKPIISSKLSKIEEKSREIPSICKFCGMKLESLVKFCHQCGTIIKPTQ